MRVIGVVLLVVTVVVIFRAYSARERINAGFDQARGTPVLTSAELEPGASSMVDATYRYAHDKLLIRNATKKSDGQTPGLIITFADGDIWELVYAKEQELLVGVQEGPITVTKTKEFAGEIEFLNFACGCEKLGASAVFYVSLAFGAVIVLIALFLIRSANPSKPEDY